MSMTDGICPFDSQQHFIIKTPLFHAIKENAPSDYGRGNLEKLFMYRHLVHGTYVLAQWVRAGGFVDVYNFGCSLQDVDRTMFHDCIAQMSPGYLRRQRREYALRLAGAENRSIQHKQSLEQEKYDSTMKMATWKSGWNGASSSKLQKPSETVN